MLDVTTLIGGGGILAGVLYALVQGIFKLLDRRALQKSATRDQLLQYLKDENAEGNQREAALRAENKQLTADLWRVRQELYRHHIPDPTQPNEPRVTP